MRLLILPKRNNSSVWIFLIFPIPPFVYLNTEYLYLFSPSYFIIHIIQQWNCLSLFKASPSISINTVSISLLWYLTPSFITCLMSNSFYCHHFDHHLICLPLLSSFMKECSVLALTSYYSTSLLYPLKSNFNFYTVCSVW